MVRLLDWSLPAVWIVYSSRRNRGRNIPWLGLFDSVAIGNRGDACLLPIHRDARPAGRGCHWRRSLFWSRSSRPMFAKQM